MNNRFSLVWEDSPDTPITAQNLSKTINKYADSDKMLSWDSNDSSLKLKANSKATLSVPVTNAMFSFENVATSHDGRFIPSVVQNITYRNESTSVGSQSIGLETASTNYTYNGSFEDAFAWGTLHQWSRAVNGTSTVEISTDALLGTKCAKIDVDVSGSIATLFQTCATLGSSTRASASFYYKSTATMKLQVIGNPEGTQSYWRPFGTAEEIRWESGTVIVIDVPASDTWTRFEIPSIKTETIKTIQLKFYGDAAGAEYYIDGVQLEDKEYCSSFATTSHGTTELAYSSNIISLDEGSVDIIVRPQHLNASGVNTILLQRTATREALKLKIDTTLGTNILMLSIFDTNTSSAMQASINLGDSSAFIGSYLRIICNWKSSVGINISLKNLGSSEPIKYAQNNTPFSPLPQSSLLDLYIGANLISGVTEVFEGALDKLKINNVITPSTDISRFINEPITPNSNNYRLFENGNNDIIITPQLLDTGITYAANTNYYVWICEIEGADECEVVVSSNSSCPYGKKLILSRIIGGFNTNTTGSVEILTIWDIISKYKNLVLEECIAYNPDTKKITFEIANGASSSTITSNATCVFNESVNFSSNSSVAFNGTSTFNGSSSFTALIVDSVKIDGNSITGNNSNLVISNSTDKNISLTSSPTGNINIDQIYFKGSIIQTNSGNHLTLQTATGTSGKIILNAASGAQDIEVRSNLSVIDSKVIGFNDDANRQFINFNSAKTLGVGTQTGIQYARSTNSFAWYAGGSHSATQWSAGTGGTLLAALTDGATLSATLSTTSRFYAARIHNAVYNDLAECWDRDSCFDINYHMVAVQTKHGVIPSTKRAQKGCVGIVSDSYGFLLNDHGFVEDLKVSTKVPICLAGRVKVRISDKKIKIGDEIVSDKYGYAAKATWFERTFKRYCILGQVDSVLEDHSCWIKVK